MRRNEVGRVRIILPPVHGIVGGTPRNVAQPVGLDLMEVLSRHGQVAIVAGAHKSIDWDSSDAKNRI